MCTGYGSRSAAVGQRGASLSEVALLAAELIDQQNEAVSAQEIDQYLDALEEPKRTTLAQLRQMILDLRHGPPGPTQPFFKG